MYSKVSKYGLPVSVITASILFLVCIFMYTSSMGTENQFIAGEEVEFGNTGAFFVLSYIVSGIAIALAVGMPLIQSFDNPKKLMRLGIGVGSVILIVLICYSISDGTVTEQWKAIDKDISSSTIRWSETIIKSTIALLVLAVVGLFAGESYKLVK